MVMTLLQKDELFRIIDELQEEIEELKKIKFKRFNEEECWIYQGDDEDNLESLVCPVVICPKELLKIQGEKK